ncbi:hypothetical protein [Pontibacter sp. FD36]|nr:hypothetical protein [Pontibacter sp. FD36]
MKTNLTALVTTLPTGIADADDEGMKLYPNPAQDKLYFAFDGVI